MKGLWIRLFPKVLFSGLYVNQVSEASALGINSFILIPARCLAKLLNFGTIEKAEGV